MCHAAFQKLNILMKMEDLTVVKITKQDLKGHKYKMANLGHLGAASWTWTTDLEPLVLLDPRIFDIKFLNTQDKQTWLYDDFLGVFAHEHNEAQVTQYLMLHELDKVRQQYPKYKFTNVDKRILTQTFSPEQLQQMDAANLIVDRFAGIAHEIVISDNVPLYQAWIDKYDIEYT
jgi:hypothetical protein